MTSPAQPESVELVEEEVELVAFMGFCVPTINIDNVLLSWVTFNQV